MSTTNDDHQSKVKDISREIAGAQPETAEELEQFRIRYLGSKGILKQLFAGIKNIPQAERRAYGQLVNKLKQEAEEKYASLKKSLEAKAAGPSEEMDLTLPGEAPLLGSRHPLWIVRNELNAIFGRIGFTVAEGPEIEDDWHNFSALHFPPDHPARDMQDTFFIQKDPDILLRTHTSPVQIRVMENSQPPIRIIAPGRVYRNETISARSHCFFQQVEGLYIDKDVSMADLKQTLLYFAREMFGKATKIRLRPSYFPFTEPSAEMDVSCFICDQQGCPVCKHTGWVEVLGCGMVDPAVLDNCHIDSKQYTGFAFGMGIDRIAMLKYQIDDIRVFSENDVRLLRQFQSAI